MIQRIQSVYLFIAIVLQTVLLFVPLAHFSGSNLMADMFASGFVDEQEALMKTTSLFILCLVIILISIVVLFSYKNRILQMRLCIYNIILNLGLLVLIIFLVYYFSTSYLVESRSYAYGIVLPGLSAVLHSLAYRSIRKDDNLVKSQDRLR